MSLKRFTIFSGFIILIMAVTVIASAEEAAMSPQDPAAAAPVQEAALKNGNDTQWAWGEVVNLDASAGTITLKHLDYETDQEKELTLSVDEKTVFENAKSLQDIKIKDTLSIDYSASADGKNIAKNINFEKPDTSVSAPAQPAEEAKPVEASVAPAVNPAVFIAGPVETPVPAQAAASEAVKPAAQPEAPVVSSEPVNESPAQPVTGAAPVVQEGQAQQ